MKLNPGMLFVSVRLYVASTECQLFSNDLLIIDGVKIPDIQLSVQNQSSILHVVEQSTLCKSVGILNFMHENLDSQAWDSK